MKSPKVLTWLNTGIFPVTIMFSCGFTYKEVVNLLKRKKAEYWLKGFEGDKRRDLMESKTKFAYSVTVDNYKTGETKNLFYIVLPEQFTFTDHEYCVLAHEILHICQFSLPDILDRNKETEAEAYTHTHIMEQCLRALRNK